jgi:cell division protein FtsZ
MDRDAIAAAVEGSDMVFVTAGMGGGTGTGASPLTAQLAHDAGALTVGVVTRPFPFEGRRRRDTAEAGIRELRNHVDALIVISNERLLAVAPAHASFLDAFRLADDILHQGISGVADLVLTPGLINLDFADIRAVMARSGSALMAMGRGNGDNKAEQAASTALASPLLDGSIKGAKGILLNITGSPDLSLHDVQSVAEVVAGAAAADANIIFGAIVHPRLDDELRLTLIATGFG